MDTVAEPVYQIDPNGIPIKPGYRPPFNSESAKIAQARSASVRAQRMLAEKIERESRVAIDVLRQVRSLFESRKRGSRVVLQKSGRRKTVVKNPPDSTVNPSPTVRPVSRPKPAPTHIIPPPVDNYNGLF